MFNRTVLLLLKALHDGIGSLRLNPNDFDTRIDLLGIKADSGKQSASPGRYDDHIHIGQIMTDLIGDCSLTGYDILIIKGMNKGCPFFLLQTKRFLIALIIIIPCQHHIGTIALGCQHLGDRCALRHHDGRMHAQLACGIADALCMVAGTAGNNLARFPLFLQLRQLVEGAANLERSGFLAVLTFQKQLTAAHFRKCPRAGHLHIVNLPLQSGGRLLYIFTFHSSSSCFVKKQHIQR